MPPFQEHGFETKEMRCRLATFRNIWFRNLAKRVDGLHPSRSMVSKPRKRVGDMPRSGIWFWNLRKRVDGMPPSMRMVSKPQKKRVDGMLPSRRMVSKPRKRVGYMPRSGIWFWNLGKRVDNLTKPRNMVSNPWQMCWQFDKNGVRVSYRWLGISFAIHHCSYSSRVVCMVSIVEC